MSVIEMNQPTTAETKFLERQREFAELKAKKWLVEYLEKRGPVHPEEAESILAVFFNGDKKDTWGLITCSLDILREELIGGLKAGC